MDNKKKNNKSISIIMIVLGIILIAGGFYLNSTYSDDSSTGKENDNTGSSTDDNSNKESEMVNSLLEYSGVYTNGTTEITLSVSGNSWIDCTVISGDSYNTASFELDDSGKLVYEDLGFEDEEIDMNITKSGNTIQVTASSDNATSIYNNINGTYTLKEFTNNNWSGYYVNGNTEIIIDEYKQDSIILTISKEFSTYSVPVSGFTSETINYNGESFGETDIINIKKTENGFTLTASSSEADGFLNEINGDYIKK